MRCPEEAGVKAAYQYLSCVLTICGSHLFFCLLSFIIWGLKAVEPALGLTCSEPYPTQGEVEWGLRKQVRTLWATRSQGLKSMV